MRPGLGGRLELLGRVPAFRLLFTATLASGLGTWLAYVALMVDVWDRTHSSVWISALIAADFLPLVAVGLLLAPLVDRFSRRRLMIVADLVRVAVFMLVPFAGGAAAIVALAAVAGFATGFFRPALYAGVPNLVEEEDLPQANSLLQAIENLSWMLTPPLAGVLVSAWGPNPAYWLNAASFLASALLLAGIPGRLLQAGRAVSRGHWRDLLDGIGLVVRSRALLTVFVAWNVFFVATAGVNVAEIALAKVALGAGDFGYGLLVGATGVGLVLGSYFAGALVERFDIARLYGASIAVIAVGVGCAAVSPSVWLAAAFVVVLGLGNGAAVVYNALFVQRGAPDELRGRVFTVIMSSNYAVLGLAMAAAGPLTDAVGPRWVWAASAAVALAAAVLGYALAPRERVSA
ncbi:MAG: MFS transporter, partial [Actinomycetota bacterium]|nr:MFS transporter [Actinomycetota bacterium]